MPKKDTPSTAVGASSPCSLCRDEGAAFGPCSRCGRWLDLHVSDPCEKCGGWATGHANIDGRDVQVCGTVCLDALDDASKSERVVDFYTGLLDALVPAGHGVDS